MLVDVRTRRDAADPTTSFLPLLLPLDGDSDNASSTSIASSSSSTDDSRCKVFAAETRERLFCVSARVLFLSVRGGGVHERAIYAFRVVCSLRLLEAGFRRRFKIVRCTILMRQVNDHQNSHQQDVCWKQFTLKSTSQASVKCSNRMKMDVRVQDMRGLVPHLAPSGRRGNVAPRRLDTIHKTN